MKRLYGALAVIQSSEAAAWVTDVFLLVAGVGIALLAWALRRRLDGRIGSWTGG